MIVHFRLIICITALFSLLGCKKHQVIEPDYDRSFTDSLIESTDDAVLAAQLPILRQLHLDHDLSEIRIWTFFGAMILKQFYSVDWSDGVSGRLIRYFEPPGDQWTEVELLEFKEEVYFSCEKLGKFNKN